MADYNCAACEEIRQKDPNLIVNGFGNTECNYLKNDTGIDGNSTDCTDLGLLNDCLVGNMADEIDSYDVCDWKDYMKKFVPNVWTVLKGIICAICGIWTNIHNLWQLANRIDCIVDYMFKGHSFSFNEETTGASKLIPGTGVDFSIRAASQSHTQDITLLYIAGGLARLSGSVRFFIESFKDAHGSTKSGNSQWNFEASGYTLPKGGELIYEIRLAKSQYPEIKNVYDGMAFANGSEHQSVEVGLKVFNAGEYAYGQHGWCDDDGSPSESGYSSGHLVPANYIYIQARMMYVHDLYVYGVTDGSGATKQGTNLSPSGFMGIRMNQDAIEC